MKKNLLLLPICVWAALNFMACSQEKQEEAAKPKPTATTDNSAAGAAMIEAADLALYTKELSTDEFEGRSPASAGEALTIEYLTEKFKGAGALPGNTDGTYVQEVPLARIVADHDMSLSLVSGEQTTALKYKDEFVAWTKRFIKQSAIENSDMVFVGYGTVAPEYSWDDFKGQDMTGKTLVMLVNDPPLPDPADPASLDASVFGGKAMTYYGRWTYKFEQAAKMGAAGCFVIHETGPAGYGWEVVSGSWSKEQFDLVNPDGNMSRCAIEGWLTTESATRLFAQAGLDFEEMKKAAVSRDFQPTPLNTQASIALTNEIGQLDSHNIMAKVEGSDPELKDEYVIYTAHWDHLGLDPSLEGDQIFNGAQDNASGTGALIELAEAFLTSPEPPKRSILLMAVTAEEKGLLGSKYYAENPIYPLVKTVAVINMDMVNVFGETKDLIVIGHGNSELDDLTEAAAQEQGRIVKPDSEPEKGFFYRSDHFSFTKQGVPALYAKGGLDYIGQPEGWGKEKKDEYTRLMYHKVADEYDPEWTFIGAVQDLNLLFNVGLQLATQDAYPKWKPGTEFKALREQMLQEAGIDKD